MSLSVAGCGIGGIPLARSTQPEATSTPMASQFSPVEKLADAAAKTNQGPVTVVMRAPGIRTEARMDPDGRKARTTIAMEDATGGPLRVEVIQIDSDLYLRLPDVPGPSIWMHSDVANLPPGSTLRMLGGSDHSRAADLANCVVSAERKGGHDFTGLLDLTRSRNITRELLTELGPKARAIPFSARTSTDGSLYEFTIDIASVLPAYDEIRYAYSRMDGVDVERPDASQVTELPGSMTDRFDV
ncbi:hypothetical protein [Plantactinospora sonchi]|uniref:LppX_LprAFG lipoprotein n=1 Tax=Plantactinospora sonchi TaxID=1544735 RepID=A0ABU7RNN5_9ACTN